MVKKRQKLNADLEESANQTLLSSNGGRVGVRVIGGHGLVVRDGSLFGKGSSDPYVQVWSGGFPGAEGCARSGVRGQQMAHEVGRTTVVSKSLDPVWETDNYFEWQMGPKETPVIVCALFDKDTLSKDDPMGMVKIPLSRLASGVALDEKVS